MKIFKIVIITLLILFIITSKSWAQNIPIPKINIGVDSANSPEDIVVGMQILLLLTILSLAPAILIMITSFTRIAVVLSFLRQAIGTHQMPSNQIIIGLALFLTFFIMLPVGKQINADALQPYLASEINHTEALKLAMNPLRQFMFKQTREKDLGLFLQISKAPKPKNESEVGTLVLIPAFVISELKTAFEIGFLIYLPFLIVDMVVAVVLLSMGMMMLPPIMISLPFKLMFFVLIDGWHLMVGSLVKSFI
ncbi:MAG: flagellar type III secretion system pore protein FliP [bacterium]